MEEPQSFLGPQLVTGSLARFKGLSDGPTAGTPVDTWQHAPIPSSLESSGSLRDYVSPQYRLAVNKPLPNHARSANGSVNTLYKTELCRTWQSSGNCRYGGKCQFAHGSAELREVDRHPKYKTELCRTFVVTGSCPYGQRCRFIHERVNQLAAAHMLRQASLNAALAPVSSSSREQALLQAFQDWPAPAPLPRSLSPLPPPLPLQAHSQDHRGSAAMRPNPSYDSRAFDTWY
ncbi:hypothetical protein WJX73_007421 [Symbiochloris irregularis]|uniref:C3H1-type domain-containing protein n=1 Tax=Symbiochloris irregularis TaxID=706552 RepID=A0AAW1NZ64_9CHLO